MWMLGEGFMIRDELKAKSVLLNTVADTNMKDNENELVYTHW